MQVGPAVMCVPAHAPPTSWARRGLFFLLSLFKVYKKKTRIEMFIGFVLVSGRLFLVHWAGDTRFGSALMPTPPPRDR